MLASTIGTDLMATIRVLMRCITDVTEISNEVSTRLYFPRQLKRENVLTKELVKFYNTRICPTTEHACAAHHYGLLWYFSYEFECLHRRAQRIILSVLGSEKSVISILVCYILLTYDGICELVFRRRFSHVLQESEVTKQCNCPIGCFVKI